MGKTCIKPCKSLDSEGGDNKTRCSCKKARKWRRREKEECQLTELQPPELAAQTPTQGSTALVVTQPSNRVVPTGGPCGLPERPANEDEPENGLLTEHSAASPGLAGQAPTQGSVALVGTPPQPSKLVLPTGEMSFSPHIFQKMQGAGDWLHGRIPGLEVLVKEFGDLGRRCTESKEHTFDSEVARDSGSSVTTELLTEADIKAVGVVADICKINTTGRVAVIEAGRRTDAHQHIMAVVNVCGKCHKTWQFWSPSSGKAHKIQEYPAWGSLEQYPGDVVWVPPGWWHAVESHGTELTTGIDAQKRQWAVSWAGFVMPASMADHTFRSLQQGSITEHQTFGSDSDFSHSPHTGLTKDKRSALAQAIQKAWEKHTAG